MTLSDLTSLGTFVSSLAVAVTLFFTLLQLRQNDRSIRAVTQQTRSGRIVGIAAAMSEPFLAEANVLARQHAALTPAQIEAFTRCALAFFWHCEDGFLQHRAGTIDDAGFQSDRAILSGLLRSPAYRAAWRLVHRDTTPAFQTYVDSLLREIPVSSTRNTLADRWLALRDEEIAAAHRTAAEAG